MKRSRYTLYLEVEFAWLWHREADLTVKSQANGLGLTKAQSSFGFTKVSVLVGLSRLEHVICTNEKIE